MPLYVILHQHPPQACPVRDPTSAARLLNHLSDSSAARRGVSLRSEAVVMADHSLLFLLEAADASALEAFLAPFRAAGEVTAAPAASFASVAAGGGCDTPATAAPARDADAEVLDPVRACQEAIEAGLLIHRAQPLNGETWVQDLTGGAIMPGGRFYLRNHFDIPRLDPERWRLEVSGLVDRPLSLSLRELWNMPSQSQIVTLECAGNGRSQFEPKVPGEVWELGAVSTAEWTGVPLAEVLDRAGLKPGASHLWLRGADGGAVEGHDGPIRFERGLSLEEAAEAGAFLAYEMNGEPLSAPHGYPIRLMVPGWYAVTSVKWLTDIVVTDKPFEGHYQSDKYWFEWPRDGAPDAREPVRLMNVRALIASPDPGEIVPRGQAAVRGVAWSGAAEIARVEVSLNDGAWTQARLVGEGRRGAWQWWELIAQVDEPGPLRIRARATDMAGRVQPEHAEWNRLGYGNNAIHEVVSQVV